MDLDQDWLTQRGDLHDARIKHIAKDGSNLVLHIEDEWWNEEGLPGYQGPSPVAVTVANARIVSGDLVGFYERISEAAVSGEVGGKVLLLTFEGSTAPVEIKADRITVAPATDAADLG